MAYWIARSLRSRGFKVVVAGRIDTQAFDRSGIEVFRLKKPFRTKNSSDIRLLLLLLRLRFRYGEKIVFYSLLINNVKVFRWLRPALKWKCVSFLHGNEALRLFHKKKGTFRKNLRACQPVFANSRYTMKIVEDLGEFNNISIVSPGIPVERFLNHPTTVHGNPDIALKGKTILMLSRLVRRKGHLTVIKAVASLRSRYPDIRLVIAGSGPYRTTIEDIIRQEGIEDMVELPGFVSENDKLDLYASCDIYCMPSEIDENNFEVEGFGITFIEASAMGKIVIGTDTGGIPDAIERDRSGFLVRPGDHAQLADLLDRIFTDPVSFQPVRNHARRRALSNFSWDKQVNRIIEKLMTS